MKQSLSYSSQAKALLEKLPIAFVENTEQLLQEEFPAFVESLTQQVPVAIHLNDKLSLSFPSQSVAWASHGAYLPERPNFTLDPLWHAGAYYVQEASSMFLQQALQQYIPTDALMLDMCAAPGGKSLLISQHLTDGFLISNEYIRNRSRILAENIAKWGNTNCMVTSNAPESFEQLPHLFDAILVDAPCSGEGMFRKDENAITEWSQANVDNCVARQQDILSSAWEALKPNGTLIYSTCTYNRQENEQMVQWLIDIYDAEYLPLEINPEWNILQQEYGYRFMPHRTNGEGLYLALLRKPDGNRKSIKNKPSKVMLIKEERLQQQLNDSSQYTLFQHQELIYALPKNFFSLYQTIIDKLYLVLPGIAIAKQKGKDYIPEPALALSKALNPNHPFTVVDIEDQQALAFFANQPLPPLHSANGYLLLTYLGLPIGFVKQVGNRCNNLYQEAWRIRMNLPATLPTPFYTIVKE